MADIRGGLDRVLLKYPGLDISKLRLIGWGAGQAFTDYYPHTGLPLKYTVCPRPENRGRVIHGVSVREPEALLQEPHEDTLVVVFSAYAPEAMNSIREKWGNYRTVRAVDLGDDSGQIAELQALQAALQAGLRLEKSSAFAPADLGLFIQGPLTETTPLVLAFHRLRYPAAHLVLVTWTTEDSAYVEACRPWVDRLEQIPPPPPNGYDTRNYITRSCKVGSRLMEEAGVRFVVRARSDAVLTGSIYRTLERIYGDGRKNKGKIGIFLQASWAYIPFHFSDKLMVCRTEDMVQLWSLPEDERGAESFPGALTESEFLKMNFLDFRHYSWEARLWSTYAKKIGYSAESLEDAYRFARDQLIELDSDLQMFSIKHIPLFNLKIRTMLVPSQDWWQEVHSDFDGALGHLRTISASGMTMADFLAKRVG
jgi:hypothetical protein